ncbi:MAG: hypothetical protein KF729_04490 [Sandaracinaceae bacterium]|nr:hypothetical protein [Sandaracinaceae bacterium]
MLLGAAPAYADDGAEEPDAADDAGDAPDERERDAPDDAEPALSEREEPASAAPEAPAASEAPAAAEEPAAPAEPAPARAVRPQPEAELRYTSLSAARVNPLGLVSFLDLSARLRLYVHDSDILTQNFVGFGMTGGASPAWGRVGPLVEIQPLTILRLYASYELFGYFNTFNLFASFPSASADHSDTTIRDRGGADPPLASYPTLGGQFTAGANVQMRLGPVAARNHLRFSYASFDIQRGDRVFYDQLTDLLQPNDGWFVVNDLDVLLLADFAPEAGTLAIGARWTYAHSFYEARHFAPGEDTSLAPDHDIHRLGLLAAYTFEDNQGARFDRPTILLIAQWHLLHRFRTGADVHVAAPYLAVAFQFTGDLLSER